MRNSSTRATGASQTRASPRRSPLHVFALSKLPPCSPALRGSVLLGPTTSSCAPAVVSSVDSHDQSESVSSRKNRGAMADFFTSFVVMKAHAVTSAECGCLSSALLAGAAPHRSASRPESVKPASKRRGSLPPSAGGMTVCVDMQGAGTKLDVDSAVASPSGHDEKRLTNGNGIRVASGPPPLASTAAVLEGSLKADSLAEVAAEAGTPSPELVQSVHDIVAIAAKRTLCVRA